MLGIIGNIFKPAAKMQESGKTRENDTEDTKKVTHHLDKGLKRKTERRTAREMRGDSSEVLDSSIAEAHGEIASQMDIPSKRHDAFSTTATSTATPSRPPDEISKHTATRDREDLSQKAYVEISKDKQRIEGKPHLPEAIEKEQEAKLAHLQADLERSRNAQSSLYSKLKQAQYREQNIRQDFHTRLADYQLENQELSRHLQAAREESKQLKMVNASLQETLDKIQERAFRSMDKGGWTAPEDGKVRDNFLRLQEKIKKWAKNNALQIPHGKDLDRLTFDQKKEIIESLSGYCVPGNWDQIIQMMAPSVARKVPYLFAHAILSKDIFGSMFEDPFLTLEVFGGVDFPATSQLTSLYWAMAQIDATEAHIWRSQMLRILQTPSKVSKSDINFCGRLEANLSRMAAQRSEQLISGPVRYLLDTTRGDEQSVKKALADIYTFAGQLSLSVWTQRSVLECAKFPQDIRFHNGQGLMSAHAIHRLDDEEDTQLDGQPIIAIIQPAVLAFGNDNAEHYKQHKVWAEAIVLIGERK